jgi:hypothetical protein
MNGMVDSDIAEITFKSASLLSSIVLFRYGTRALDLIERFVYVCVISGEVIRHQPNKLIK